METNIEIPKTHPPKKTAQTETYTQRWERLYRRLEERQDYSGIPTRKVAFLSTERSGSSFLCDALDNTGQFGVPDEYFSLKYINTWAKLNRIDEGDIDLAKYLDFLFRKTTSENGVFSVKIHAYQHAMLKKQGFEFFGLGFDRVYKIVRQDKISQALSFAKADLSKAWQSGDKPLAEANVQLTHICRYLQQLAEYDSYMAQHTDRYCNETIVYEEFSGPRQLEIFNRILDENGCSPVSALQTVLARQSKPDDISRIAQFQQWLGSHADAGRCH
jgi:LPS sulfotransferase NodH